MNPITKSQDNPPESMSSKTTILVVEDESAMETLLRSDDGYVITGTSDLSSTRKALAGENYDLVIVDGDLSADDAMQVVEEIRKVNPSAILVALSKGQETQRSKALRAGADDCLMKPIRLEEIQVRVKHAKDRMQLLPTLSQTPIFTWDRIKVDQNTCRVWVSGEEVHLTPTEYRLLLVLINNAGRIVTHKQLLTEVWGKEYVDEVQYLRIYMGHLRKKLDEYSSEKKLLVTEPKVGYKLAL